jgi:hypothetical protein
MARPRLPDKDIEAAVAYAEAHGWEFVRTGSLPGASSVAPAAAGTGIGSPSFDAP